MRKAMGMAALVTAFALAMTGCSGAQTNATKGGYVTGDGTITILKPGEREPAPAVAGKDLDGKPLSLADFAGKTVVINVWGSWCPPCRQEAPALAATARSTKDSGVRFLGISIRENASSAKAFHDSQDIPYPSLSDPTSKTLVGFAKNLPPLATPTTWIVDAKGRLAVRILDKVTEATLTGLIEDVQGSVS